MAEPRFLRLSEVLTIHRDQLARYGGSPGLRDQGLLESALGTPAQTMFGEYLHKDLAEMAAAYLFHLVQNHPFIDGNKRVGTAAALVFLLLNGQEVRAPGEELEHLVLAVAAGQMSKEAVTSFLRQHSRERSGR